MVETCTLDTEERNGEVVWLSQLLRRGFLGR